MYIYRLRILDEEIDTPYSVVTNNKEEFDSLKNDAFSCITDDPSYKGNEFVKVVDNVRVRRPMRRRFKKDSR